MAARVRIGVWERGAFVGCLLFSRGASPTLGHRYGLGPLEVAELARVALGPHATPASRILAIGVRMFAGHCPGTRLLVSFADPAHGHVGTIYQAAGWTYTGASRPTDQFFRDGRWVHRRDVKGVRVFGRPHARGDWDALPKRVVPGKHRYLRALDEAIRAAALADARPYPRRAGSIAADATACQAGEDGSNPIPALVP
jgi:hypothetical protein